MNFFQLLNQVQGITKWILAATAAAPLVGILLSVAPPWPNVIFVALATVVVEAGIITAGVHLLPKIGSDRLIQWLLVLYGLTVLAFFAYTVAFAVFVREAPDFKHHVVIGYTYTDEAKAFISVRKREGRIPSDGALIADFGNSVERIWTVGSVTVCGLVVLFSWLLLLALVFAVFTLSVVLENRRGPSLVPKGGPSPEPDIAPGSESR